MFLIDVRIVMAKVIEEFFGGCEFGLLLVIVVNGEMRWKGNVRFWRL